MTKNKFGVALVSEKSFKFGVGVLENIGQNFKIYEKKEAGKDISSTKKEKWKEWKYKKDQRSLVP